MGNLQSASAQHQVFVYILTSISAVFAGGEWFSGVCEGQAVGGFAVLLEDTVVEDPTPLQGNQNLPFPF